MSDVGKKQCKILRRMWKFDWWSLGDYQSGSIHSAWSMYDTRAIHHRYEWSAYLEKRSLSKRRKSSINSQLHHSIPVALPPSSFITNCMFSTFLCLQYFSKTISFWSIQFCFQAYKLSLSKLTLCHCVFFL